MARGVVETRGENFQLRGEALDQRFAAPRDRLLDRLNFSADILADMARGVVETRRKTSNSDARRSTSASPRVVIVSSIA